MALLKADTKDSVVLQGFLITGFHHSTHPYMNHTLDNTQQSHGAQGDHGAPVAPGVLVDLGGSNDFSKMTLQQTMTLRYT